MSIHRYVSCCMYICMYIEKKSANRFLNQKSKTLVLFNHFFFHSVGKKPEKNLVGWEKSRAR